MTDSKTEAWIQTAQEVLTSAPCPPPTGSAQRRMWAGIEEAREPRPKALVPLGAWPLAASVVVILILMLSPSASLKREPKGVVLKSSGQVASERAARDEADPLPFNHRGAHFLVFRGTKYSFQDVVAATVMDIDGGEFEAWLADGHPPLTVKTPHGLLTIVSGRFRAALNGERLEVEVTDGVAAFTAGDRSRLLLPRRPMVLSSLSSLSSSSSPPPPPRALPRRRRIRTPRPAASATQTAHHDRVRSLARSADEARRAGRLEEAAALYQQLADHPQGSAYAEEALLRRARALHRLSRPREALQTLRGARRRFESGPLSTDRKLLKAGLLLEKHRPREAARVLLDLEPSERARSAALTLRVARALAATGSGDTCRLITRLEVDQLPTELRRTALALRAGCPPSRPTPVEKE